MGLVKKVVIRKNSESPGCVWLIWFLACSYCVMYLMCLFVSKYTGNEPSNSASPAALFASKVVYEMIIKIYL